MMCRFAAKFVPFAASASSVLLPVTAQPQLPAESTRMIDVMGTPARVVRCDWNERRTGQPVLFLHGGAGSRLEDWGQWLSTIARLTPVVTFDRPGVGQSPFEGAASAGARSRHRDQRTRFVCPCGPSSCAAPHRLRL